MKILVNAATATVGGGVQVATSFIEQAINSSKGHDYLFVVSKLVAENVQSILLKKSVDMVCISPTPACLLRGRTSRQKIKRLEVRFKPDIVYSISSPSYVRFQTIELARFTDPWVTHPNRWVNRVVSPITMLEIKLTVMYKVWALRQIQYFQTQSETARQGLLRCLKIDPCQVRVISNCYNEIFGRQSSIDCAKPIDKKNLRIFVLAHPYPHKNLAIVPDVAQELKQRGLSPQFIMTMPHACKETKKVIKKASKLGVLDQISNVGRLTLNECLRWYYACDIVFLPTLLETFSATYLEAMAMKKPIITTDLDFAHDICGEAAEYYDPLSSTAAADAIYRIVNEDERYKEIIDAGTKRLMQFPTSGEKYCMQIQWLEEIVHRSCRA